MNADKLPRLGNSVHYVDKRGYTWPATITQVHGDGVSRVLTSVDLFVMRSTGFDLAFCIPHDANNRETTWHWPPEA